MSLKALRMYEKVSEEQQKFACKVFTLLKNKSFAGGPMPSVPVSSSISASPGVVPYNSAPVFGSPQNCSINMQMFNCPSYQQFQGMNITQIVGHNHPDDDFNCGQYEFQPLIAFVRLCIYAACTSWPVYYNFVLTQPGSNFYCLGYFLAAGLLTSQPQCT